MKHNVNLARYLIAGAAVAMTMTASAFAFDIQGGTVTTSSSLNMRSEATTSSSILKKLPSQSRVCVLNEAANGWYKVVADGSTGYVSGEYLSLQPIMNIEPGGAKVTTEILNMRSEPTTESKIITKLYKGNVAKIIGINTGWLKVTIGGNTGYIHPDYIMAVEYTAPSSASKAPTSSAATPAVSVSGNLRSDIIAYGKQFLGVSYVYGGSTPKGFDCSGFTSYVFRKYGIDLSRSSSSQYSSDVTKVKKSDLNTGDLVFFGSPGSKSKVGHVGIYISGGSFIHASSPGDVVKIDSINSGYYNTYYIGGGSPF